MAQDGGKVVSLTYRPPLPPGYTPGTHFFYRLSRPQGHSAIGRIMSIKNSNDTICNRTSDLPICSTAPKPLCYCGSPSKKVSTLLLLEYETHPSGRWLIFMGASLWNLLCINFLAPEYFEVALGFVENLYTPE